MAQLRTFTISLLWSRRWRFHRAFVWLSYRHNTENWFYCRSKCDYYFLSPQKVDDMNMKCRNLYYNRIFCFPIAEAGSEGSNNVRWKWSIYAVVFIPQCFSCLSQASTRSVHTASVIIAWKYLKCHLYGITKKFSIILYHESKSFKNVGSFRLYSVL